MMKRCVFTFDHDKEVRKQGRKVERKDMKCKGRDEGRRREVRAESGKRNFKRCS